MRTKEVLPGSMDRSRIPVKSRALKKHQAITIHPDLLHTAYMFFLFLLEL
jgi:hypothetical protein